MQWPTGRSYRFNVVTSGQVLAQRLAPVRPAMAVIFISGYIGDAIIHQGLVVGDAPFLQKPIVPEQLLGTVRDVLDRGLRVDE